VGEEKEGADLKARRYKGKNVPGGGEGGDVVVAVGGDRAHGGFRTAIIVRRPTGLREQIFPGNSSGV